MCNFTWWYLFHLITLLIPYVCYEGLIHFISLSSLESHLWLLLDIVMRHFVPEGHQLKANMQILYCTDCWFVFYISNCVVQFVWLRSSVRSTVSVNIWSPSHWLNLVLSSSALSSHFSPCTCLHCQLFNNGNRGATKTSCKTFHA